MRVSFAFLAAAVTFAACPAVAQSDASTHKLDWPGLVSGDTQREIADSLAQGPELQRGRPARAMLEDSRRLAAALAGLAPQRKGRVDAYIVSIALDSDPVFAREAREAGKVLARRYDAAERTLVLAGSDGPASGTLPRGSLTALTLALARIAEVMDRKEDVLVLYATSHGAHEGIAYHDGDQGYGVLAPRRLAGILDELGLGRRVLILSACYSGVFVPLLSGPDTALFTAASSDRPSFGCRAENDWTFFGDAMVNHALRKPQPLRNASDEARMMINHWESGASLPPSNPQVSIGDNAARWLAALEAHLPRGETRPVGRPATDALR